MATVHRWLARRRAFSNREGLSEFDFELPASRTERGVSAMVRVKDEARYVERAVRSIRGVFDEVVVIDNGSRDGTREIVEALGGLADEASPLRLLSYPHRLALFGSEHAATPVDSVHSAVYFTNWCLSHCRYSHVCKWDGDMILRQAAAGPFRELLVHVPQTWGPCWELRGQTVYEALDGSFWLDPDEVNSEIEIFPIGAPFRFMEHPRWERLRRPVYSRRARFEPVCFLEMKFVGEDEFAHWAEREWTTSRKRLEWDNFHRVRDGRAEGRLEHHPPTYLDSEGNA